MSVEYTDDSHPRNIYWEMWRMPMSDTTDASACFSEVEACREAFPNHYIKVNGYNARYASTALLPATLSAHRPAKIGEHASAPIAGDVLTLA